MEEIGGHRYVPWRYVQRWRCLRCGRCCVEYLVPLYPQEAVYYLLRYGDVVEFRRGKYYLKSRPDGSCIFLEKTALGYRCSIYFERPLVCRCYPFYITEEPLEQVGSPEDALYLLRLGEKVKRVYVYIDLNCPGVGQGYLVRDLVHKVVLEWYTKLSALRSRGGTPLIPL